MLNSVNQQINIFFITHPCPSKEGIDPPLLLKGEEYGSLFADLQNLIIVFILIFKQL